jgi:aryl-alcohol dehydrogenase-like predicted oxidoreductase
LWVSELGCGVRFTSAADGGVDQAVAAVRAAHEQGVTFFQAVAGDGRGLDEQVLTAGLRGVPRDEVVLCGGGFWRQGAGPDAGGLSRKRVLAAVHACLRRWDIGHLDVLALPRSDATPLAETFDALSDLVRQGLVHYVMPTEWTMEQLLMALPVAAERRVPLVAGQAHYSMVWRVPETQALPAAERLGLGWVGYAPLGRGVFTGKYTSGAPGGSRAARPDEAGDSVRPLLAAGLPARVELLRGVAEAAGLSLAQLALAWPLQHGGMSSVVVGASSPEQVRENCAAVGVRLALETLIEIDELLGSTVQSDPRFVLGTAVHPM